MFVKLLLIAAFFSNISQAMIALPSESKVSIYDFCGPKVPCAPGHLCHEGFCIQQQSYGSFPSFPRSLFYRSLYRR
ncbi:Protein CBG08170 [Caenorhabditis briggsae]|uniref:Uncharacterized protein n=2 Tax=Caenorhabditis briggsae TaxID=6238 RepID=A0AAE9CSP7_CAEBR|nr:Protein CBG08170 [Caenorhabditis briggsae]ULT79360.1 hypothetical protein L3Y34_010176 [Caenorhabditis briggsae]UMM38670.1 hypothetical protein L5515_016066 [Caenorhabditis briggsae]CAP28055.2 Protein CBG08170 [Caenorhabditis briggsae]